MRKKRAVTLIEIMIVILLIGMIGGALAFNMRGSLDKGRIFKSQQYANRVHEILMLEYAKTGGSLQNIVDRREAILKASPIVKNGASYLKDAWGIPLTITISKDGHDLDVISLKAEELENGQKAQ